MRQRFALLAMVVCADLAAGTGTVPAAPLYPQPFFEVGDASTAVAAADLNGDGVMDLLVGARHEYTGCAASLLGGVPALLAQAGCLPVGGEPRAFAFADFDQDGHQDVAIGWRGILVTDDPGGLVIALGNGDGTFHEVGRTNEGRVDEIATGDFNGDGVADLAVVGWTGNAGEPFTRVVPGLGGGAFGAPLWEDRVNQTNGAAAGDFDGDGVSDFALSRLAGNVEIYLGSVTGGPTLRTAHDVGMSPQSVVAADLDGDGRLDLAVVNVQDSEVRTYAGLGNGNFQARPGLALPAPPGEMAGGDFDGDGRADLAVVEQGATRLFILTTDGNGGLRLAGTAEARGRIAAADLDDDGLADLIAASGTGVAVLRSLDDFAFAKNETPSSGLPRRGAHARDFNLDGRDDLAVYGAFDGTIDVSEARPDGSFGTPLELQSIGPPRLLRSGDFNGDGSPDLVAVGGTSVFFFGDGDGGFGPARTVGLHFPIILDAVVAEMNGDGRDDLIVLTKQFFNAAPGYIEVAMLDADGAYAGSAFCDAGNNPQGIAAGDFDADGDPDLATTPLNQVGLENVGSLHVYPNRGDLVFDVPFQTLIGGTVRGVAAADFNGDGIPDLAVAVSSLTVRGALQIFLGAPGGVVVPAGRHDATLAPVPVLVRDMDGDGALDLVTVGSQGGDVALLRGDGAGGFAAGETSATFLTYESITAGDFNGDGLGDLALTNQNTNFGDGRVLVVPARPPFPCLPAPGGVPGQCVQDAVDVRLSNQASAGRGAALVTWRTTREFDLIGFNIVEVDPSGNAVRQNAALIPCVECVSGLGGDYAFVLARHKSLRNLYVEMLRRSGPPRLFGPVARD